MQFYMCRRNVCRSKSLSSKRLSAKRPHPVRGLSLSIRVPCSFCRSAYLSVSPLVTSLYCGKTADLIKMPFGVVVCVEYRNVDGQLRSALNVATSCANMVRFGAVTPEKLLLILYLCEKMAKMCKNIRPIISECARPILINVSDLIDIWVGIINLTLLLMSLTERCYDNQLIGGGAYCKRQN